MFRLFTSALLASVVLAAPAVVRADDSAQDIWKAKCKGCHGDDGKAQTRLGQKEGIGDFSSPAWQAKHSDEFIRAAIANGSRDNPKMKAYKDRLSAQEIGSLITYIRGLKR
jgi:cytochrome c6